MTKPPGPLELHPTSLVFHNGQCVVEVATDVDGFWIELGPEAGFAFFMRVSPAAFRLQRVQPALTPGPYQRASVRGVLWSRRAAIEADRSISSFLAAGGPIEGS